MTFLDERMCHVLSEAPFCEVAWPLMVLVSKVIQTIPSNATIGVMGNGTACGMEFS